MGERPELSLWEGLAPAPDPRWPRGRQHPLAAGSILWRPVALAVGAMRSGGRSLYAVAQWGRGHPELAQSLGFTREQTPCLAPLNPAFRRLAGAAFAAALSQGALAAWPAEGVVPAGAGKALRGLPGDELTGGRLVAAYAVATGLVVGQRGVRSRPKASELGAGRELLAGLAWAGKVVTGDAL